MGIISCFFICYFIFKFISICSNLFNYKFTSNLKRKSLKRGKQYSKQPKFVVEQVRKYRNEFKYKVTNKKISNYTHPYLRKKLFLQIKAANTHGTKAGQWSARKAQYLAKKYKALGGGYY